MSRSWDLDGDSGKVEFTRFPVGDTRIRVLDSAPHVRWTHWMNQFGRSINCPGINECPVDDISRKQRANKEKTTYNSVKKFSLNVYNYETQKVEIMEQGINFMEDLKVLMQDLQDDGAELSEAIIRVRRTGTGMNDTRYRLDINERIDEPIPDGVVKLEEYFKAHTKEQITELLSVQASNPDEYKKEWDRIVNPEEEEVEEEFKVE